MLLNMLSSNCIYYRIIDYRVNFFEAFKRKVKKKYSFIIKNINLTLQYPYNILIICINKRLNHIHDILIHDIIQQLLIIVINILNDNINL